MFWTFLLSCNIFFCDNDAGLAVDGEPVSAHDDYDKATEAILQYEQLENAVRTVRSKVRSTLTKWY